MLGNVPVTGDIIKIARFIIIQSPNHGPFLWMKFVIIKRRELKIKDWYHGWDFLPRDVVSKNSETIDFIANAANTFLQKANQSEN